MKRIKRRPFLAILACLAIPSSVALGADVSGKWFGVFHVVTPDGGKRDDKAVLILKQQGDEVTGSLGETEEKQLPFKKGKMNGNMLTIEMEGNPVVFTLKLEGDSRPNGTPEEAQATEARANKRREQVSAILAKGGVQSAEDYFRAALVFQHSIVPDDHLMAHILATIAGYKGHKRARWLSAAALDAYLQSVERPQIFGTVYLRDGQRRPFDKTFLSDPLREGFCVPRLVEQEKNVEMLKEGGSPVGLKRIANSCEPVDAP